jgi:hypothetical protein
MLVALNDLLATGVVSARGNQFESTSVLFDR